MGSDYILTPEGREKLEQELHYLETEKRAEVGERIKVAREFGDISENSEYDDAKNEQGMERLVSPRSTRFSLRPRSSIRRRSRTKLLLALLLR